MSFLDIFAMCKNLHFTKLWNNFCQKTRRHNKLHSVPQLLVWYLHLNFDNSHKKRNDKRSYLISRQTEDCLSNWIIWILPELPWIALAIKKIRESQRNLKEKHELNKRKTKKNQTGFLVRISKGLNNEKGSNCIM